ncbi:bifunctional sugar-1-phosphate nucleotidylyltransferase/acetyltransferase [Halobellus marinus]|jgi:UDP-N-acetylglucosamine diphosphorylase/glucosamine-1-phosphate N-acetyltransferase|nr:bifunctional sugar-1-phosphate nucleotidylyltransferase/acetyltransferase [Halobellus sp. DFY28]
MGSDPTAAVILAAGAGRRLHPLTRRRPKPMIPVANRPILEYIVESVADAGIEEIVFVVGYERNRVQTYFGDGDDWGVSIRYVVQENQLGTAHAVAQAEPHIDSSFVVLNGDRIIDSSVVAAVGNAVESGPGEHAMAVTRVDNPQSYAVVTTDNERIQTIVEKPQRDIESELINAGVYGFTPAVFDAIRETNPSSNGEYELPDTLTRLIATDGVQAVPYGGPWHDVSFPWDLLPITDLVLDRIDNQDTGTVAAGAQIDERSVLADTAFVGGNAVIGANTTVGENVHIESNATVKNSVVFSDVSIEAGAVLKDSIVGEGATIGANTTVRGGRSTIAVRGELYEKVRLGAVVGDNTQIGGGAVLSRGTIIGNEATVGEGCLVSGRIGDGETVRRG